MIAIDKGGLYLGSIKAAHNIPLLQHLKINSVLTVSNLINTDYEERGLDSIDHKIVPIKDDHATNLLPYFDESIGK